MFLSIFFGKNLLEKKLSQTTHPETAPGRPGLSVLGPQNCLLFRVGLDQQPGPVELALEEERVGHLLAVKRAALDKKPVASVFQQRGDHF